MKYQPTIGLEIHIELKTKSKMFCFCPNTFGLEREPNINICPVCTGQPGVLPVINEEAIGKVLKTALALNCQIPEFSKFDRKNYFYPDLPKGYQISQYDKPLSVNGYLDIDDQRIRIRRIHLEEDTGKLVHPVRKPEISNRVHPAGADYSLVDLNRAGVPLMELVTEPDIESGTQARKFCQELQLILRYLDVSDADMEKGQMRCEVNISLSEIKNQKSPASPSEAGRAKIKNNKIDDKKLGTKVEIKNLNSFRSVERAIDYEIERQSKALSLGEKIVQETRGWDDAKGLTVSQRTKEEAHDYRYFPEPDLPPLKPRQFLEKIGALPELPAQRCQRFLREYQLSDSDIEVLTTNKELGEYFEAVISELRKWEQEALPKIEAARLVKLSANYLITELQKLLYQSGEAFKNLKITPENFAEFIKLTAQGVVSSSGAQTVLKEMFVSGADPSHVIREKDLGQVSDEEELNQAVAEALSQNPVAVTDYKNGKQNALMFLVGKVMVLTRGKANPQIVMEILKKKIRNSD